MLDMNDGNAFGASCLDGLLDVRQYGSRIPKRKLSTREIVVLQIDHEQCLRHAFISLSLMGSAVLWLKAVDSIRSAPKVNVRSRDIDAAIRTDRQGIGPTQSLVLYDNLGCPVRQQSFHRIILQGG